MFTITFAFELLPSENMVNQVRSRCSVECLEMRADRVSQVAIILGHDWSS
jgi:hypothetical protein